MIISVVAKEREKKEKWLTKSLSLGLGQNSIAKMDHYHYLNHCLNQDVVHNVKWIFFSLMFGHEVVNLFLSLPNYPEINNGDTLVM